MLTQDPLPTAEQRELLGNMLHIAFVELRALCWNGRSAQAADLADAFHNIPHEMNRYGAFSWDRFRTMLEGYQYKWRTQGSPASGVDYVSMLDEIRRS